MLIPNNKLPARSFRLSLLRMSDGSPHPDAIEPIIIGTDFGPWRIIDEVTVQATGCRLAVRVSLHNIPFSKEGRHENLFIWDWRTGQKYFVGVIPSLSLAVAFELVPLSRIIHTARLIRCASLMISVSSVWSDTDPGARKR